MTTTLIFNQAAIKVVRMTEDTISVYYADGNDPIHISKDDDLYEFHLLNFMDLKEKALTELKEKKNPTPEIVSAPKITEIKEEVVKDGIQIKN